MIFDFFRDVFFPRACVACRRAIAAGAICEPCLATISLRNGFFCPTCGRRRPFSPAPRVSPVPPGTRADARASDPCRHAPAPYLLGGAGNYADRALQRLVHALKFERVKDAAEPLGGIIARYLAASAPHGAFKDFSAVPIPLSRRRERARGFNQSTLIAKKVAETLNIPFQPELLKRTRHAKPQSETTSLAERAINLRDCFAVPDAALVRGAHILLIDDVATSGATFLEAARVLAAAGAKKIVACAAAKVDSAGTIVAAKK